MGKLAPFMSTLCRGASFPAPRCLFLQRILSRPSVDLDDTRLEIAFCPPTHSNRDLSQRHIKIEMNDMMKRGPRASSIAFCFAQDHRRRARGFLRVCVE